MLVLHNRASLVRRGLSGVLTAAAICVATACSDSITPRELELQGPAVNVGNGTARTFVREASVTHPTAIGVELSASALDGLPTDMTEWVLPLPAGIAASPWDHVGLNWNPQGHEPAAIYGVPHFDFHFYDLPTAEQMQIPGGPDNTPVPAANIPTDYASQVISVPMMGVHWADTLAAEFHGSPFDKTFIYGFSQGKMVFVEPMVTRAMLISHPDVTVPVKQPQSFQQSGFYPDQYSVRYDPQTGNVRVTLESLQAHP